MKRSLEFQFYFIHYCKIFNSKKKEKINERWHAKVYDSHLTLVRIWSGPASCVWSPHTDNNITKLERVRSITARLICNRHWGTDSVTDMVKFLDASNQVNRKKNVKVFCVCYIAVLSKLISLLI